MAVPQYIYLVLKILGSNGIITVKGSFELSDICDKEFHKMAQTFGMTSEYKQLKGKTEKETTIATRQPKENKAGSIEPEAKKLRVQTKDPKKICNEQVRDSCHLGDSLLKKTDNRVSENRLFSHEL
jgi:hypothetical protein